MSNEIALPTNIMERLAAQAKAAAAKERPAVGKISLKSGVMTYQGAAMPGNKTEAIILAASYRNVWYAGRYDANNIVNPNCFALALDDEGMAPHENVEKPEHPTCEGCAKNEWGSDPNGGRGKACKQTRRLVLIPASVLDQGAKAVSSAEFAILDVPVTSVKNYSGFVNTLSASVGVPPHAAVCEISIVPDAKTQFKVRFQPLRVVPNEELLNAIEARMEQARSLSIEPYEETAGDTPPPAAEVKKPSKKF